MPGGHIEVRNPRQHLSVGAVVDHDRCIEAIHVPWRQHGAHYRRRKRKMGPLARHTNPAI